MRRFFFFSLALLVGCEASDPAPSSPIDSAVEAGSSCAADRAITPPPPTTCTRPESDFVPGSATDGYAACISDDGAYHNVEASVSSLTRVAALERIAELLGFGTAKVPSPADFIEARAVYSADEGIASRVARREDEHYPPAAKLCRDMTAEELAANRERCAGPAKILPILTKSFADGANGLDPLANAARIEAALLWHFYLSAYKESRTCRQTARDCDSMWAKYTGGEPRGSGKGLARYVRARSVAVHEAIYDGVLAVRCWRDLDNPTGTAMDTAMHDRATAQLDRGLLRGLAIIVRQRAQQRSCGATWEGVRILGGVLDREATVRNATTAAVLRDELSKPDPATVDEAGLLRAIDALFPCP